MRTYVKDSLKKNMIPCSLGLNCPKLCAVITALPHSRLRPWIICTSVECILIAHFNASMKTKFKRFLKGFKRDFKVLLTITIWKKKSSLVKTLEWSFSVQKCADAIKESAQKPFEIWINENLNLTKINENSLHQGMIRTVNGIVSSIFC